MKLSLSFSDVIIIFLYYILIAIIGIYGGKSKIKEGKEKTLDFLLAGRKLTLPLFVASLVATWYGNILGIGEFVHRYGLVAWFCFGIVYYVTALFYALFVSNKIRNISSQTIPELLELKYGKVASVYSSLVMLLITFPSVYVLMVGVFINLIFGLSLLPSIILGTILTFIYIGYGGYKSNVITNTIQFILMYFGFGIFTFFALKEISFDLGQLNYLPKSHLKFFGEVSWQYIITWLFISLQTFIDPSFFQRCASVNSEKTAKKGILISITFWFIFDTMTIFTGLVGKLKFPEINPLFSYPILLENIVPSFFKGIVLVSMLATIVSTLESYSFLSALIIGKNIMEKFRTLIKLRIENRVRIGLVISAFFSIFLAYFIPSAIDIIYKTSSIAVPSLFYPTITGLFSNKTFSKTKVNSLIISSSLVTFIFVIVKEFSISFIQNPIIKFFVSFEPMVFGFVWSTIFFIYILLTEKRKITATTQA
ncbi:MAG: sodium:solute symporter family protein [Ignavibacteria bacterium]|nr:sodium:solute symporter family protein [Ignavibacteria bacterium]